MVLTQAFDQIEPQPHPHRAPDVFCHLRMLGRQGEAGLVGPLHDVLEVAEVDVHGTNVDAMVHHVPNDLGRGIEAHGLTVEQRRCEHIWVVAFDPAGHVNQQGKRGRVALWEPGAACRCASSP